MANPYVPIIRAATVAVGGTATLDWSTFGNNMGSLYIHNKSGTDGVWLAFDAVPAAATLANGRLELLPEEALNLDAIQYQNVGLRVAGGAAGAVDVEAIGMPRPGSAGTGLA